MWKTSTLLFICLLSFCCLTATAQSTKTLPAREMEGGAKIVKLYPNPASSIINFEIQQHNNDRMYELIVYNFLGKQVDKLKNINARTTVDLGSYYSGVYIFQLRDREGNLVESGKFNVVK
ncbi:T9SS type A sorting domain-containing protein [Chitinophaga japonensis]|uniref:Putative secreted protein (Por secretion system target) n=2 Tax=Chitinophaga japonensis TaxID=104662 RepID=A0A562TB96_CHIJA|nr:T9SS type A sorting domain-containing protein [Chitinophaga japonensis]TWI90693.1 putative secreted protein (Por secretion system target) [Chitinophaga japonensis]